MKPTTLGVLLAIVVSLLAVAALGLGGGGPSLSEQWVSDTPRDTEVNHHAVGVGPNGTVVAPVTAEPGAAGMDSTSCALVRLDPETGAVEWRWGVRPDECTSHALTEPAIADVDGDGELEVMSGTTESALVAVDAATGDEDWRVPLDTFGYGKPAVGNLTAAPGPEVVASDIQGGVVVTNGERVEWRATLDASTWASPVVADVDGDGGPEALVGTIRNTTLFAPDGSVEWQVPVRGETLTAVQADDDPALEVIGTQTGNVTALDGATGELSWHAPIDGVPAVHHAADGDGDGTPEVYMSVSGGLIAAHDAATGDREWTYRFQDDSALVTRPPSVGDVGGGDGLEVVAIHGDGTVAVLDAATGSQVATYSRSVPILTYPTLSDVDGDGTKEIFVRYGDGRVARLDLGAP